jgi:uncharacterized membrane protein YGL010W
MQFSVPAPMRARLNEYEGFHRSTGNEVCHFLGIPSIVTGAAALLALVPIVTFSTWRLTLAELVAGAVVAFYLSSARLLGIVTGTLLSLFVVAGRALPWTVGLALFAGGWALQFLGHAVYEKRSPAFLKNLLHLLVGPAWLVERAFARL